MNETSMMIQCPECKSMLNIEMSYTADDKTLPTELQSFFDSIVGDVQHYSFRGSRSCECGKVILSCLTVSAHESIGA